MGAAEDSVACPLHARHAAHSDELFDLIVSDRIARAEHL
jgi:hypothetical protein